MIRHTYSITEFDTNHSSLSTSPNGYYFYDDPCPSPSRYSPVTLTTQTNSPSKIVSSCKNCALTFRVRSQRTTDFCSKDCETCFTLFNKTSGSATKHTPVPKTAEEIRRSIYEFQNQIDREEAEERRRKAIGIAVTAEPEDGADTATANAIGNNNNPLIPPPLAIADPSMLLKMEIIEEEYEEYRQRMRAEKAERKLMRGNSDASTPKSSNPATPKSANSHGTDKDTPTTPRTLWGINATAFFFKTPKPIRPQLHPFI